MYPHSDILEQSVKSITYTRTHNLKLAFYYISGILTLGLAPIFIYWTELFKHTCWTT